MNRLLLALCPLFFALFLGSCFEPKSGCLDISATNFDAGADNDCCCVYPKLVLTVNQVYDSILFLNNSYHTDANGRVFQIKNISFYLSDFHLVQGGKDFQVSDTLTMKTFLGSDTSSLLFTNDFQLVRRTAVEYTLGTFQPDGAFDEFRFRLGLSTNAQKIIPSKAPTTHPLYTQADNLWRGQNEGFVFLQAVVVRDTLSSQLPDTLRFTEADLGQPILVAQGSFVHPTGYDFKMVLKADYAKMFEGINSSVDDIPTWKSKIIANLINVFSVSQ